MHPWERVQDLTKEGRQQQALAMGRAREQGRFVFEFELWSLGDGRYPIRAGVVDIGPPMPDAHIQGSIKDMKNRLGTQMDYSAPDVPHAAATLAFKAGTELRESGLMGNMFHLIASLKPNINGARIHQINKLGGVSVEWLKNSETTQL
ncbi:MAG: hypothetical protein HQ511_14195 [Rhodospirillales bacterium]|nr:hypothetical protein [Rhodospirillales bacterium]